MLFFTPAKRPVDQGQTTLCYRARKRKTRAEYAHTEVLALNVRRLLGLTGTTTVVALLLVLAVACGGGGEENGGPDPTTVRETPSEEPSDGGASTELELTAKATVWDTNGLEAPADQPLTLVFHNEDGGIEHNFVVYTTDDEGESDEVVFSTELFAGVETKAFDVPALEAGTYLYLCTIHTATMTGTLTVE